VDALVIGGGPAGSLAAIGLARLGWRTALVERGPVGRDKSCGHCLHPATEGILRSCGLWDATRALARGGGKGVRIHHWRLGTLHLPRAGGGLVVPRRDFDQLLRDAARAAGAQVLQPASAAAPRDDDGRTLVAVRHGPRRLSLHAGLVVGADGLGSAVARWLAPARPPGRGRCYGFSFDRERPSGAAPHPGVDMFLAPRGYLGLAQEGTRVHVGAMVRAGRGPRDPLGFTRAVAELFPQGPLHELCLSRLEPEHVRDLAASGPMPFRPARVADRRGALVGDASGYAEPFTGEGITWALRSAAMLVEICAELEPGRWDEESARRYRLRHRRIIQRRQRLCAWLGRGLGRPRLCTGLFWLAARRPWMVSRLVAGVGL
jgi:flavin-dependent dehydrogenase